MKNINGVISTVCILKTEQLSDVIKHLDNFYTVLAEILNPLINVY